MGTAKQVMLYDVAGSIMSPMTYSDYSVTCSQCEPSVIQRTGSQGGPGISGVQRANANQFAQCWAVSTGPTRGGPVLMPPSWHRFLTA